MLKYIMIIAFVAIISLIIGFLDSLRENWVPEPENPKKSFLKALKIIIILLIALIIMWFILKWTILWIGVGFIIFIFVFLLIFS